MSRNRASGSVTRRSAAATCGYNPLVATLSTPPSAPVVATTRLCSRRGQHDRRGDQHCPILRLDRRDRAPRRLHVLYQNGHQRLPTTSGGGSRVTALIDAKARTAFDSIGDDQLWGIVRRN